MNSWKTVLCAATLCMAHTGGASANTDADGQLRIIAIDVEGGTATLVITPQGHSMLVDAGWPAGSGGGQDENGKPLMQLSSAQRIVAVAKAAGLEKIDYVVVTHYHVDHVGGVAELVRLFPTGTFIDHGPNRESPRPDATPRQMEIATEKLYPEYLAAIADKPHRVMQAGETFTIDDLSITAITSDGNVIANPLPTGGEPGRGCAQATVTDDYVEEENPRSLGMLMTWGEARILALADLTWNMENKVVCPMDPIGPVDLMFSNNHGSGLSNSPPLINSAEPIVMVMANGARKGADPATFDTIMASPRIEGLWQLHYATRLPDDKNAPADQIVNPAGVPDMMYPLMIAADMDGTITLTNPRNGFSRSYHR